MIAKRNVMDRFTSKVIPEPNSGCWLWFGGTDGHGYGKMRVGGKLDLAHRLGYKLLVGPIPRAMCVCHKCDVPLCVNPDHMFLGTAADNIRDSRAKGRHRNAAKTRCIRGHDLSNAPSYAYRDRTERRCRECSRIYYKNSMERRAKRP